MMQLGTTIFLYLLGLCMQAMECDSLKCYKCLNLDCPNGGPGERNEKVCQSVRTYIVKSIIPFYEVGPAGYIGACPSRDETLQWSLMHQNTGECPEIREGATCSLGRIQVITGSKENVLISHATILGCLKPALLYFMKNSNNVMSCSIFKQNNTRDSPHYIHQFMLENCPKVTDYCNTRNFCVPFDQSLVKEFQNGKKDNSFENGMIIGIIAVILVLIVVAFLAGTCQNPMRTSTNYTPTRLPTGENSK